VGTVTAINEDLAEHVLKAAEPVIEEVVSKTLEEDLQENITVLEEACDLLASMDPQNRALKVLKFNMERAKDPCRSIQDRHDTMVIAFHQTNQELFDSVFEEDSGICAADLTKVLIGFLKSQLS
jgi:hypothetical protein